MCLKTKAVNKATVAFLLSEGDEVKIRTTVNWVFHALGTRGDSRKLISDFK